MKILCLYNNDCAIELFEWIREQGNEVIRCSEKLDVAWCKKHNFDLTVSYTYRYILKQDILSALNNNVVNIHNSYLPWNRGADPNIWSWLEGTPRGVTLHYMTSKLDGGDIITQKLVIDNGNEETLKSTYTALDIAAKQLFKEAFFYYDFWEEMKKKPSGKGSYHSLHDGEEIKKKIKSFDIRICDFKKRGEKADVKNST